MNARPREKTIQEFIEENNITAQFTRVPENPNIDSDPKWEAFHFHVVLRADGRHLTTYYSTGMGNVERAVGGKGSGKRSLYDQERFALRSRNYKPVVSEILDCLAGDSQSVEFTGFEEWADDMGYGRDSRRAEATYKLVEKQAADLENLLGGEAFTELLEIERL